jgi:hypothetical protein
VLCVLQLQSERPISAADRASKMSTCTTAAHEEVSRMYATVIKQRSDQDEKLQNFNPLNNLWLDSWLRS